MTETTSTLASSLTAGEAESTLTPAAIERASTRTAADAIKMQLRAQELRHRADWAQARGDLVGPRLDRREAKQLEYEAELALDPMLRSTGTPLAIGNGGEAVIGNQVSAAFIDVVRQKPDMLAIEASSRRMELADGTGVLTLAVDAAQTIQAQNSLERMLAHQLAAAHNAAMLTQAEAFDLLKIYRRTGHIHQSLSIEAGRLFNVAARMMDSFQSGLLALTRVRSGAQQVIVVRQHIDVGDGGRAMVAGQVKLRGKDERRKQPKGEGQGKK